MIHSAGRVLPAAAAAHDEDPNLWFGIDAILRALEPPIEPPQSQRQKIRRHVAVDRRVTKPVTM